MSKNSKTRYMAKNVLYFFTTSFLSKLIAYILLPIFTNYMTPEEYGIADILMSTNNMIYPVVMLGLAGAVLRFCMDEKEDKGLVITSACLVLLVSTIVSFVLVTPILMSIDTYSRYAIFVPLMCMATNTINLQTSVCKATDKLKFTIYGALLHALVILVVALVFVVKLRMGVSGYLLSYLIANLSTTLYLGIRIRILKYVCVGRNKKNIPKTTKRLLKYGVPLVPNSLAWWITQLSDRYMVTYCYGNAVNGVYSVAYKIPSILNMAVNLFMQAWQLSVIKEYGDKDSTQYYDNIYRAYSVVCYFCGIVLITATRLLSNILFAADFYEAWRYVPILLLASVLNSQEGYWGTFYLADNRTTKYFMSSVVGAILNFLTNLALIPKYGAIGASVATAISYFVVYIQRAVDIRKRMGLQAMIGKNLLAIILLAIQAIVYVKFDSAEIVYGSCGLVFLVMAALFAREITISVNLIKHRLQVRR